MPRSTETVGEMWDRCTPGPVTLPENGHWWITRKHLGVTDGVVSIDVADGDHCLIVTGSPAMLRRLADAIVAQVEGAEVNTYGEPEDQEVTTADHIGTGPEWTVADRVRLVHTNDRHTRLKPGATGTVTKYRHGPDGRIVSMKWDDGSTLTMLLDEGDQIERIST